MIRILRIRIPGFVASLAGILPSNKQCVVLLLPELESILPSCISINSMQHWLQLILLLSYCYRIGKVSHGHCGWKQSILKLSGSFVSFMLHKKRPDYRLKFQSPFYFALFDTLQESHEKRTKSINWRALWWSKLKNIELGWVKQSLNTKDHCFEPHKPKKSKWKSW